MGFSLKIEYVALIINCVLLFFYYEKNMHGIHRGVAEPVGIGHHGDASLGADRRTGRTAGTQLPLTQVCHHRPHFPLRITL